MDAGLVVWFCGLPFDDCKHITKFGMPFSVCVVVCSRAFVGFRGGWVVRVAIGVR